MSDLTIDHDDHSILSIHRNHIILPVYIYPRSPFQDLKDTSSRESYAALNMDDHTVRLLLIKRFSTIDDDRFQLQDRVRALPGGLPCTTERKNQNDNESPFHEIKVPREKCTRREMRLTSRIFRRIREILPLWQDDFFKMDRVTILVHTFDDDTDGAAKVVIGKSQLNAVFLSIHKDRRVPVKRAAQVGGAGLGCRGPPGQR